MDKNAKIFVAGARGLVGSAIVEALRQRGYTNLLTPSHDELDLTHGQSTRDFFAAQKPEYVIVAAARVGGIKANMTYQAEFLYENLAIQNHVLWNAHLSGVTKLLFLGSNCVYPREAPQPMREEYLLTGPFEPTNEGYAVAKMAGIKLTEKINAQFGKPFISCLPPNIYGPRDHFDPERGHVMAALIRRFHEALTSDAPEISIWGTGVAYREFLHAHDLADATLFLLEHYDAKEPINVGTGEDISIRDLAYLLKDIVGFKGEIVFDASKPDGMPRKLLDTSKISALGWTPRIGLREGIKQTYEWYVQNLAH